MRHQVLSFDWFLPLVIFLFLFSLPSENYLFSQEVPKTSSSSTAHDFQDIKKEVGYSDPQRFGKAGPVTLISWLLIASGVWCLIAIFLYALFNKSSIDSNWVREQSGAKDEIY